MKQRKVIAILAMILVLVLSVGVLAACNKDDAPDKTDTDLTVKPWEDGKTYSYRMGPASLPNTWNYHTYQSNDATYILDYTSDALYTFDYKDDTYSSFTIVPSMASGDPTDVTANYVGKYGVTQSDVANGGKVYSIPLKTNLKFDNGEAITANTFVESMKLLLNPDAANFRADNVYKSGNLKIVGAEAYVKQNSYGTNGSFFEDTGLDADNWDTTYIKIAQFTYSSEGVLQYDGRDIIVDLADGGSWGSNGLEDYAAAGYLTTGYQWDTATERIKVLSTDGTWILTRSIEADTTSENHSKDKVDGEWVTQEDYSFYDLEGNKITRYINEAGKAWVYLDKDGNEVAEWAGCAIGTVSSCYDPLAAAADDNGLVKLTADRLRNLQDCIAMLHGYSNVDEYNKEGEYADLLPAYYAYYLSDEETVYEWKAAWNDMDSEDQAEYASETYKTYDSQSEAWTDCTGVNSADDYVAYLAYKYAHKAATDGSTPNEYAYLEWEEMVYYGKFYSSLEYTNNVGFFAIDEYTLGIALKNAMADNFYLRYELCSSFFLVNPTLYRQCMSTSQGVYTNTYGTSVATFVGYGPYKLTQYVADSTIVLERNMYWHGYSDEEYQLGTYQTDVVKYTQVKDNSLRLQMFLKGELDSYGLQAEDMSDYITSDYTYYTDSESTWYLAMNPDYDNLKKVEKKATSSTGKTVIKTPLSITEFRQALSYSLDREAFNLLLSPTSGIAKGLLSEMIIVDPDNGVSYRSTDQAKDALLEFWGLADAWGEGEEYETRDDAIASITGYDPSGAKALFTSAYNTAVAKGMIPSGDNWVVQIIIGIPVTANFYNKGAEFLATNWTNAVKGTPWEGHLEFINSQELGSSSFGDYLRNGSVDLLFGVGYGGSMFDPYSMMDCFTGVSLQYDQFTDMTKEYMDITYDFGGGEKTYRASLYDWVSVCLQGDKIKAFVVDADGNASDDYIEISAGTSDPIERRIAILAKAEVAILNLAHIFPMQTDSSASLRCMRVNYKTEEYILGMGRGGIQYYTYEMDDETFLAYAQAQEDGVLNYKG